MLKVASQQPLFLPWAGFWNRYLTADAFVLSAGVDFTKNDTPPLNRVKLNGTWLTVPVSWGVTRSIKDVLVVPGSLNKVGRTIRTSFGKKYPFRERAWDVADTIDGREWKYLFDLNFAVIATIAKILTATTPVRVDFQAGQSDGNKTARLFERLSAHIASPYVYLSGKGTAGYLDKPHIPEGIDVLVQQLPDTVSRETALTLIATDPEPAKTLGSLATWEPL